MAGMGTANMGLAAANLSAYDALSVSLAETIGGRLINADPRNGRSRAKEGQPRAFVTKHPSLIPTDRSVAARLPIRGMA